MSGKSRGPKVPVDGGGSSKVKSKKARKRQTSGGNDVLKPLLLMATGMALVPLIRKLKEWMDERTGGGDASSAGVSSSGASKKAKGKKGKGAAKRGKATAAEPMKKPPGAASLSKGGSMPRSGKMQSNKKNKARKAERKEERRAEAEKDKHKPGQLPSGHGGKTVIREGNNVPKDEDIVGGEAGKTFTTTSHVKVPTWYAKVREERGNP